MLMVHYNLRGIYLPYFLVSLRKFYLLQLLFVVLYNLFVEFLVLFSLISPQVIFDHFIYSFDLNFGHISHVCSIRSFKLYLFWLFLMNDSATIAFKLHQIFNNFLCSCIFFLSVHVLSFSFGMRSFWR